MSNRPIPIPGADWRHRAACRYADPELFFAPDGATARERAVREAEAQAVCAGCPVAVECGEWALVTRQDAGVWGGFTEDERRDMQGRVTKNTPAAERAARRADILARLPTLAAAGHGIQSAADILETATNYITRILNDAGRTDLLHQLYRNAAAALRAG